MGASNTTLKLSAEQRAGSHPEHHVWLSASAGTGKTAVLSSRVLRLLLSGVKPDHILCLTFTKAGATEMATRVHQRLTNWVRMKGPEVAADLMALGEDHSPERVKRARTLFAEVLEARGGGLRIMTIHSFAQTLLANFPMEAGLSPGFRPIEGREVASLEQQVLSALIIDAEREQPQLMDDLCALSLRMGEDKVMGWLRHAGRSLEALETLNLRGFEAPVRIGLGLPRDTRDADMIDACCDGAFDQASLASLAGMQAGWGTATGAKNAARVSKWLSAAPEIRVATLADLRLAWATQKGTLQANGPKDLGYKELAARMDDWCGALILKMGRIRLATEICAALRAGLAYGRAYSDAKRARGLVDFDDLIGRTRMVLGDAGIGDWIRYKLDQATDHILVDEAQDTNADQWAIVAALAEEYWAGAGAKEDKLRTLFTVGDYKQAIFGFQGTDPAYYEAASLYFSHLAEQSGQTLHLLPLTQSYRSTPPVLAVVDVVLDRLGSDAVGLATGSEPHRSFDAAGAGQVILLPPVSPVSAPESDNDDTVEGEEDWQRETDRMLATRIAKQVRSWLDGDTGLTPGDIMILCRRRKDLAALIVARLIEEKIDVAGVDRLRLQAPLVVQDVMAVVRFVLQPRDDLNLASLLVSPLVGWDQDDLFAVAQPRGKQALWDALPDGQARDRLRGWLGMADLSTPYRFLEAVLTDGRKRLFERLGEEARDPIDELLIAALQFEREGVPTLQGFADWFDRGETDVARDADAAGDAVRVLTVHGSKGLQAPMVILADACANPDTAQIDTLEWQFDELSGPLPLFNPRKAERALCDALEAAYSEATTKAEREHWRLLYVAMTRAERTLVVAGALSSRDKGEAPKKSWYHSLYQALTDMGAKVDHWDAWGDVLQWGDGLGPFARRAPVSAVKKAARPDWIDQPAPQESHPPRPLAPSSLGHDDGVYPPPSQALSDAAERGRLLHSLFERLPSLAPSDRRDAGRAWLGDTPDTEALLDCVLNVIDHPDYIALFVPDALVEVPIAGVVDGVVVSGTVDRLVILPDRVLVIDFKTGRSVPHSLAGIPRAHLRQMAAYGAVLAQLYPERRIETALLYSEGPLLHGLPQDLLDTMKPNYQDVQNKLALSL